MSHRRIVPMLVVVTALALPVLIAQPWRAFGECPHTAANTSNCPGAFAECSAQPGWSQCGSIPEGEGHEVLTGPFSCVSTGPPYECQDDIYSADCTVQGTCLWYFPYGFCYLDYLDDWYYTTHV